MQAQAPDNVQPGTIVCDACDTSIPHDDPCYQFIPGWNEYGDHEPANRDTQYFCKACATADRINPDHLDRARELLAQVLYDPNTHQNGDRERIETAREYLQEVIRHATR